MLEYTCVIVLHARTHDGAMIKVVGQIVFTSQSPPVTIDKHMVVVVLSRIAACQTAPMYTAGSQFRPAFAHENPAEAAACLYRD